VSVAVEERAGRCAANWWAYCWGRKRTPYGTSRREFGWATPQVNQGADGWQVRLSVPRRYRYGIAAGRAHPLRKTHIVRDVIVARRGRVEVRRTNWLCGATTFDAVLQKDEPPLVCSACLLVAQRRSVEPMP
jgi:hypothetical protein